MLEALQHVGPIGLTGYGLSRTGLTLPGGCSPSPAAHRLWRSTTLASLSRLGGLHHRYERIEERLLEQGGWSFGEAQPVPDGLQAAASTSANTNPSRVTVSPTRTARASRNMGPACAKV